MVRERLGTPGLEWS